MSVLRSIGADVFVVPAMGSHGGATAEGQREVLASLGVTETSVGCEIRSSMDTVRIGEVRGRIPVFVDRHALSDADVVIPINRVKPHTDFSGPVESGLLKMIAIGLGKQLGADTFHREGFATFAELIPEVGQFILSRINIPFGLALVENGHARLLRVEAVPADGMFEREQEIRAEADGFLARLPIDDLDVLIIDRIGKDVSGLGMDSNVVGRYYTGPTGRGPGDPAHRRPRPDRRDGGQCRRHRDGRCRPAPGRRPDGLGQDLHELHHRQDSRGRPRGADGRHDHEALDVALACCLGVTAPDARIARIVDTKHLGWFYASAALLPELEADGRCEIAGSVTPIGFDADGQLTDALPL